MDAKGFLCVGVLAGLAVACHRAPPPSVQSSTDRGTAERTVFTDSLLHAEHCQPLRGGEDWRKICTPLDQSAPRPVRRLP